MDLRWTFDEPSMNFLQFFDFLKSFISEQSISESSNSGVFNFAVFDMKVFQFLMIFRGNYFLVFHPLFSPSLKDFRQVVCDNLATKVHTFDTFLSLRFFVGKDILLLLLL